MNQNYKTDTEFEEFLKSINGLENGYRIGEHPILNRGYFSIGNGWLGLTQRLIEDLIKLGWNKETIQVKEKFGTLCFYTNKLPENGIKTIIGYTNESVTICEICGESGQQHKINNWIYTLCETHKDEKKKR